MRLDDYNQRSGKKVWLSLEEMEMLVEQSETAKQRVAFTLGGKAGLRREEIVNVTRNDFVHGPTGFLRVWDDYAKRSKYREAPIPSDFESYVVGVTEDDPPDKPVIDVHGSTIYRWVKKAANRLYEKTRDRGWGELDVHDLRRSWGGHLLWVCGVSPMAVMQFGGWEDWETFKRHYMGEMPPEAMNRERSKIDYVGGKPADDEVLMNPPSTAADKVYGN